MEQQLERLRLWWENLHPWVVVKFGKGTTDVASFYWTQESATDYASSITRLNEDPKKGLPSFYRPEYRVMSREAWNALKAERASRHNR